MAIKGIVKFVSGLATATDQNGTTRVLQTGDRVYAGEVINTDAAPGTVILVELDNGAKLDLPSGSSIAIDPALFKPEETARPAGQTEQEAEAEVAKLQKALENGEDFDPNQLPPTAAGAGGAGGAGNEGHTFLDVSYLNPAITPDSGFPTTGPAIAFGQIQPFFDFLLTPAIAAAALPPAPPAGAVPVITLNPVTATEGEEVVFTATVSTPSATPFSITLTNGVVINFAAGATTGSSDPLVLQADDPYIDASTATFGISSLTLPGLNITSTATLTITDSIDTTVVTLNPVTGVENGQVVYTATLNNPPQTPFSITLSNGVVINFAAGATTGSSDPQTLANDVYTNGVSETLSIVSSSGGNFEAVDISDTAPLTVTDSIDTTVVRR
ncbi:MAG: hypothetical protein CTY29_08075 [Methylobacter sp.]|nr:MAG: hypothetical protein CTY29_08075 [Methylobacter sp.]